MKIERVSIIGAGTMGSGIAINLAQHGIAVRLFDARPDTATAAIAVAAAYYERAVEKGRMAPSEAVAAAQRLGLAADLTACRDADLILEAVFEDFQIKAALFEEVTTGLPASVLVATNTSCLRVGDLARHVAAPQRFLGMHYFSPAAVNPIVEVVSGPATGPGGVDAAMTLCRASGKQPIRCRDSYGFAINRFFCPYTNEAVRLTDEAIASPAEVDEVAKAALGVAMGPFAAMNLIKPRINLQAIRNLAPLGAFYAAARSMVAQGEADRPWVIGNAVPISPAARAQVLDRLRAATFLPVLQLLDEEVAGPADIDLGAGAALKMATPPCALMDALGRAEVTRVIEPFVETYGLQRPRAMDQVGRLKP